MAFCLTLVYIVVLFITPPVILPWLAPYRIQLWLALAALACSMPTVLFDRRWRAPQLAFFAALVVWIPVSLILGPLHYLGGAIEAVNKFLPEGMVFILVIANCRSLRRLKLLLFTLLLVAGYFVFKGAQDYYRNEINSPFIFTQKVGLEEEELSLRIRGLGTLNDPNDFAQFMLVLIPFVWLGWRPGQRLRKAILIFPVTALLLWGIFLTHSRGAIVGLAVTLLFALRKKLGTGRATVLTGCLFAVLLAMNFAGGRQISMQSGSDRLDLWGDGLQAFKTSPLFGVGFGEYADAVGSGHTAHNSFVLCLAELGVIGYFFWLTPVVFTFSQLHDLIHTRAEIPSETPEPLDGNSVIADADSINRFAVMARLSLIGFLTTSWFLSRGYSATCWIVLGIAIATIRMGSPEESAPSRPWAVLMRWSAAAEIASIAVVYVMVRISNLGG
jgi:O-antigen ligase